MQSAFREFEAGGKQMSDNFIVRFAPFPGKLDAFKEILLAKMNPEGIESAIAEQDRQHPGLPKVKSGVPSAPVVTATTLGGRDAFEIDVTNTLTLGGDPVTMVNRTVFAKFGPEIVTVVVGYIDSREAQVKPLQAPFLGSINFDRCK